ncbi:unnamed protein product, partial [Ectocarpus fasciculatus]
MQFKRLRKTLEEAQEKIVEAATAAAVADEVLLTQETRFITPDRESGERTYKLKQKDMRPLLDMNTSKNIMDLYLTNFGPYRVNYSRNGRFMLIGGARGHVATFDALRMSVGTELQLQETVHDIKYLHNETFFAVAQEKYTYIYDHRGMELHCLNEHERVHRLDFLPYHYLMVSIGHSGFIKWHDISIGNMVSRHQTGHGPCNVLKHNRTNGMSHVGHNNGVVSLWSPSSGKAAVSMFCHRGPVTDLAIDREGNYMATAGMDSLVKIWDVRNYRCVHSFKADHPVMSVDISDTGLLALGLGREVQVLKDAFQRPADATYLRHEIRAPDAKLVGGGNAVASKKALSSSIYVGSVMFRPLEDVLAVGHTLGISTVVVPGAGEANFDSFESNPFIKSKQRNEAEIQSLLTKLSPDMIGLDAKFVGTVDKETSLLQEEHRNIFYNANAAELKKKEKNKKRGRNKISAKLRKKQKNVIDAQSVKLREKLEKDKEERKKQRGDAPD